MFETCLKHGCGKVDFLCLKQVTEARTGRLRRELELLRSHPKDERRECEGGRAADPVDATLVFCGFSPQYAQKSPLAGWVRFRSFWGVTLVAVSGPVSGLV